MCPRGQTVCSGAVSYTHLDVYKRQRVDMYKSTTSISIYIFRKALLTKQISHHIYNFTVSEYSPYKIRFTIRKQVPTFQSKSEFLISILSQLRVDLQKKYFHVSLKSNQTPNLKQSSTRSIPLFEMPYVCTDKVYCLYITFPPQDVCDGAFMYRLQVRQITKKPQTE